jgi:hypothetical protein
MLIAINKEVECWFPILNYEGFYEISNLGRVKSLKRNVKTKDNKIKHLKEKILIPKKDESGYVHVILSKNNIKDIRNVHRLVCENYFKDKNFNKSNVNHKNGIKDDNRLENLEFVTSSENHKHKFNVLGYKQKPKIYIMKPVIQFDLNGNYISMFCSIGDAAKKTNSHERGISACINGGRKTANKFKWEQV